jgi:ribosomal protein L37E
MHTASRKIKPEYRTIPQYRIDYIELKLAELKKQFHINSCPVDCVDLLKEMKKWDKYPVYAVLKQDMPEGQDGATVYLKEHGCYQIWLNRRKFRYPYRSSTDRRLNFTVAHEIGHILLEHLMIPKECKLQEELDMEEREANEFAARLLMPEKLVHTCNFYSIDAVSSYMNVSKSALMVRLNHMGRRDLVSARKIKSCSRCGNIRFSSFAEYCGVCGQPIQCGLNGIRRIYYPDEISMDRYKRAQVCPKCKQDISGITGDKCNRCGTYIFNYCSDFVDHKDDGCTYANPGYARYCEMCERPTYYYVQGFLDNQPRGR